MIPTLVYILCIVTCMACAFLLFRAYRRSRSRLLMWSTLCFLILALANLVLFVDMVLTTVATDLQPLRSGLTLLAIIVLLCGMIFESQ